MKYKQIMDTITEHQFLITPAAFCCTGIQGTESWAVDSEASIAKNRFVN